ncbi:TPA: hypothetical protein ACKP1B_000622 [Serratia fonticola]
MKHQAPALEGSTLVATLWKRAQADHSLIVSFCRPLIIGNSW